MEDIVQEDAPYDHSTYEVYIEWYSSRTRVRIITVVDDPPRHKVVTSDTVPYLAGQRIPSHGRSAMGDAQVGDLRASYEARERFSMPVQEIRAVIDQFIEKTRRGIQIPSYCRPRELVDSPVRHALGLLTQT